MNLQIVETIDVAAGPWTDYEHSTPLTDIRNAIRALATPQGKPVAICLPFDVALVLADHPSIVDVTKYVDPATLDSLGLPPTLRGLKVEVFEDRGGNVIVGFEDGRACAIRMLSATPPTAFADVLS
jgi:hypothetical protein